jgi:hypothetical protein
VGNARGRRPARLLTPLLTSPVLTREFPESHTFRPQVPDGTQPSGIVASSWGFRPAGFGADRPARYATAAISGTPEERRCSRAVENRCLRTVAWCGGRGRWPATDAPIWRYHRGDDQRRSGASGVAARRDVADHRERPGPALLPRRTSGLDRALWDTFPVSVAPSAVDMGVASRRLSSLPVSRTSLRVALLGRSPCRSGARRSRARPGLPQLAPVCRDAGPARRVRDWKTAGRYEREARCGGRPAGGVACAG